MKSRGIIIAWVIGESIVFYRGAFQQKRPIWPSEILWSSLIFISLGFIAEIEELATPAVLLAFGFDIAAFMRFFDPAFKSSKVTEKPATPQDGGGGTPMAE